MTDKPIEIKIENQEVNKRLSCKICIKRNSVQEKF